MPDLPAIPRAVATKLGHYVYVYVNPLDDKVFYVGKGQGFRRALAHLHDADKPNVARIIRSIRAAGEEPRIDILAHSLPDARTALSIEAAAIDLLGVDSLANSVRGHRASLGRTPVKDLVGRYTRRPAKIVEPALLVRIGYLYRPDMSDQEIYDATRSAWRLGKGRELVEYAFAVYEGVVREVYRVAAWLPAVSTFNSRWDGRARRRSPRWEFVGTIAPEPVRKRYRGKYVGNHFKKGNANPVMYLNIE